MTLDRRPPSTDAQRLIDDTVHSVGVLDLLLLVREEPERWWTPDETSEKLHCPVRWAALELEDLRERGLLQGDGEGNRRYRFRPQSTRLARAVDALAEAYEAHTGEVVRLIFTAGSSRRRRGRHSRRSR
jgi:hypothetical protein